MTTVLLSPRKGTLHLSQPLALISTTWGHCGAHNHTSSHPKNGPASPTPPSFSLITSVDHFSSRPPPCRLGLDCSHHVPTEYLRGKVITLHHTHGSCGIQRRKSLALEHQGSCPTGTPPAAAGSWLAPCPACPQLPAGRSWGLGIINFKVSLQMGPERS